MFIKVHGQTQKVSSALEPVMKENHKRERNCAKTKK